MLNNNHLLIPFNFTQGSSVLFEWPRKNTEEKWLIDHELWNCFHPVQPSIANKLYM
jgi:hypothetical protein